MVVGMRLVKVMCLWLSSLRVLLMENCSRWVGLLMLSV